MTDNPQIRYDEQIDKTVLGFVQVRDKFESTLAKELTRINYLPGKIGDGSRPDANYELFYRVSSSVSNGENLTMGELSDVLSVPLSTATRIVDYFVERDYMRRLPDPGDRRVVRVALTPKGRELHQAIDNHVKQRLQHMLSCLNNEEREHLFVLLGKVLSSMEGEQHNIV